MSDGSRVHLPLLCSSFGRLKKEEEYKEEKEEEEVSSSFPLKKVAARFWEGREER